MDNKKLDKIISIIREQMVANAPGAQGGFGGTQVAKGPSAGFDPIIGFTKKKKYASLGVGSRKRWMKKNNK